MEAHLVGQEIHLRFSYDPQIVARVKTVPGRSWDPVAKRWSIPARRYPEAREILGIEIPELETPPPPADWWQYADKAPAELGPATLMRHQRAYRAICRERPRFLIAADTGTGKTLIPLAVYVDSAPCKMLVVCPLALVRGAWQIDARRFLPGAPFLDLHAIEKTKRAKALRGFQGIACINYESFKASQADLKAWAPDVLIADESAKLKGVASDISKQFRAFAASVPRVYLLSGTPAPNSELEYFVQGQIVGAPWGKSYHGWRGSVAESYGYGGHQWRVTSKGSRLIREDLSAVSWHVHKNDVLDLPERTFVTRQVDLTDEEWEAYRDMAARAVAEIEGQEIAAPHVLTQLGKLRQGTSGFMYPPHADEEKPVEVWAGPRSSKIQALVDLLEEIGPAEPVVVWAHYEAEYRAIARELEERCVEYTGRIPEPWKHSALAGWLAGSCPVLLASPASIGHGVTLTRASYMVWFSGSYSYEQYHQANDRIYRYGQRNACTYYHLVVPETIDEVVLGVVQKKAALSAKTLEFLKGLTPDTGVKGESLHGNTGATTTI